MDQAGLIRALIITFVLLLPVIVRAYLRPRRPTLKYSEELDKKTGKRWHVYLIRSPSGREFLYVVPIGNNGVVNQSCIAESINVRKGTAVAVVCPEPLSSILAITKYSWYYWSDVSKWKGIDKEGSIVLDPPKSLWFLYQVQIPRFVSAGEVCRVIGHVDDRIKPTCEFVRPDIEPVLGNIDTGGASEVSYAWIRCWLPITAVSIETNNNETITGIPIALLHPGIPVQKRIVTNYPPKTTPSA
jgi:hypothetical protein